MNPFRDIKEFHEKFGLAYDGLPRALPSDLADFRANFGREEIAEYQDSNQKALVANLSNQPDEYTNQLNHNLDALVDQLYVLMGTIYMHGYGPVFPEAWRRVHEKNMQKVRVEQVEDSKRGSTYDVVKPQGWAPPCHKDLVEPNQS